MNCDAHHSDGKDDRYCDAELDDYGEEGSGEEGGESEGEDENGARGNSQFSGRPYVPPASSAEGSGPTFGENMESHFIVPRRLQDKPYELVEAANDWHFAMMNDIPRNEFYHNALAQHITPETVRVDIGASLDCATLPCCAHPRHDARHHCCDTLLTVGSRRCCRWCSRSARGPGCSQSSRRRSAPSASWPSRPICTWPTWRARSSALTATR